MITLVDIVIQHVQISNIHFCCYTTVKIFKNFNFQNTFKENEHLVHNEINKNMQHFESNTRQIRI